MRVFQQATAEKGRCICVADRMLRRSMGCTLCGPNQMALKPNPTFTHLACVADLIGIDSREIEDAFICEDWRAELATGLLWLGPETATLHGIANTPCGIMDLIRLYDPAEWAKVLQALEEAATVSTAFSFATTIQLRPGLCRPVFCFGQSEIADGPNGVVNGTFAIARLCVKTGPGPANVLN